MEFQFTQPTDVGQFLIRFENPDGSLVQFNGEKHAMTLGLMSNVSRRLQGKKKTDHLTHLTPNSSYSNSSYSNSSYSNSSMLVTCFAFPLAEFDHGGVVLDVVLFQDLLFLSPLMVRHLLRLRLRRNRGFRALQAGHHGA